MREIYRILAGEHKGKYCYIVNRLSNSFRVCIGEGSEEERYLKLPFSYVDESAPLLTTDVVHLLNEKQMAEGKHE